MIHYPDPKEFKVDRPTFHQRYRVIVHSVNEEEARTNAERINHLGLPCDIECFLAVTDGEANENRGEVVLHREFCGVAFEPVTGAGD